MKQIASLFLAVVFVVQSIGFAGEIEDLYKKQESDPAANTNPPANPAPTKADVSEIGLERTPCFGTCPVYTLVIKSDGTVRYHGEDFVDRKGNFTGTISKAQFEHLAALVIDNGFLGLNHSYSEAITDHATVFTTAVVAGHRRTVSDYAHAGPKELKELEQAITDILAQVKWDDKRGEPMQGRAGG